jgi:hypothetical protein
MIEIVKVVSIKRLGGYRLRLRFSDGTQGERDFSDLVAEGGEMVEPLANPEFFAQVFLELGTLAWPNGFDLDSIALHGQMKRAGLLQKSAA